MIFENRLKRLLNAGKKTAGAWLQICSPFTAEIMGHAGFDWLLIDLEHAPGDLLVLISQLQALNGTEVTPLVRAPWNDLVIIKRILDTGVQGILAPYINTREEAEAAVRACKYPPLGVRGVAGSPRAAGFGQNPMSYLTRANQEILVFCAAETALAAQNLDQILQVEGLDGIFIGPMDLATSLGHMQEPNHPDVLEVIASIESKTLAAGKVLATVSQSWEQAEKLYQRGYSMVTLMADGASLATLAGQIVRRFRDTFPR